MIVVDSSVWIDHLRTGSQPLADLLEQRQVLCHSAVLGELALGNLMGRGPFLNFMQGLPQAVPATHQEVMSLIERHELWGRGIGYVDAHLLASTRLSAAALWTTDRRLATIASDLEVQFEPEQPG